MVDAPVNTSPDTTTLTIDADQPGGTFTDTGSPTKPSGATSSVPANNPPANTSPAIGGGDGAGGAGTGSGGGYAQTAPYAERILQFTFQIGAGGSGGQFTVGGQDSKLQATAHIDNVTYPGMGWGQFRIWGLTIDHINAISVAGMVYAARSGGKNAIACQAGDAISGLSTVFNGIILEAWPDISQPDTPIFILASSVGNAPIQLKPVPPASFPGPTQASTALDQMCKEAGVTFENNGVSTILQSPYFHGTIWSQIGSVLRASDCFAYFDGISNTLAAWPKKGGSRSGGPTMISAKTGMIGYPKFQQNNIKVRTLFNSNISIAAPGNKIQVYSEVADAKGKITPLSAANGVFLALNVTHELSSQLKDGPWETDILAYPLSDPAPPQ